MPPRPAAIAARVRGPSTLIIALIHAQLAVSVTMRPCPRSCRTAATASPEFRERESKRHQRKLDNIIKRHRIEDTDPRTFVPDRCNVSTLGERLAYHLLIGRISGQRLPECIAAGNSPDDRGL